MQELINEFRTMIFYESPHRLKKTLLDLSSVMGTDRTVVIARELTKIHEEIIRGTLGSLIEEVHRKLIKGEIVIVIQGKSEKKSSFR